MRQLLHLAAAFALSDEPILLLGERGTGKTTIARHIHELSHRPGEFILYPLTSTNDDLHAASLFGHTRGAFTGATRDRTGLVEAAHDGTLFLDEVGNASLALQSALLGLFDSGGFRRIGEDRSRPVTARILVATNVDVRAWVNAGKLRQDLLDRLGFLELSLPPLRDRRGDIIPLFRQFLHAARRDAGESSPRQLEPAVEAILLDYSWPGNVRQLEHVACYVDIIALTSPIVTPEHLPREILAGSPTVGNGSLPGGDIPQRARAAVRAAGGNKAAAARTLGISRPHLYRLLERTGPD